VEGDDGASCVVHTRYFSWVWGLISSPAGSEAHAHSLYMIMHISERSALVFVYLYVYEYVFSVHDMCNVQDGCYVTLSLIGSCLKRKSVYEVHVWMHVCIFMRDGLAMFDYIVFLVANFSTKPYKNHTQLGFIR
jgi:hypothetical protein